MRAGDQYAPGLVGRSAGRSTVWLRKTPGYIERIESLLDGVAGGRGYGRTQTLVRDDLRRIVCTEDSPAHGLTTKTPRFD